MNRLADIGVAIVGVAALMVVTRPGSKGAELFKAIGGIFTGSLQAATDQPVSTGVRRRNAPSRNVRPRRRN